MPMATYYSQIINNFDQYLGRYEVVDGKSNKFWECLPDADHPGRYATRWGSNKQTKTKHNTKVNMTQTELINKIIEKIDKKGYKMVERSRDPMQSRLAAEDVHHLDKATAQVQSPPPEAPPSARRRL